MRTTIYIAKRYFWAKRSPMQNRIAVVSILSIAISAAAMVVILSVMNGMSDFVMTNLKVFNSDFKIELERGRSFSQDRLDIEALQKISEVSYVLPVLEEQALLEYADKMRVVYVKGVSSDSNYLARWKPHLTDGSNSFFSTSVLPSVWIGQGLFENLGLRLNDPQQPLSLYMPPKGMRMDISTLQNAQSFTVSNVFLSAPEYDYNYILAPLDLLQEILKAPQMLNSVEIGMKLESDAESKKYQKKIQACVGEEFIVKNRLQQNAMIAKTMASEKIIIIGIFAFVLLIATFTMSTSLRLLIHDKEKEIQILQSMGATNVRIRNIFFLQGLFISFTGAIIGMILGAGICYLQESFSLVKFAGDSHAYLLQAYPVKQKAMDFLWVLSIVLGSGALASCVPVLQIKSS